MSLSEQLKEEAKKARAKAKYVKKRTMQNVRDAAKEMVLRAKEVTPPKNGEERGKNTVTGTMAAHWGYSINETGQYVKVRIFNPVQYSSYVDSGHKMKEHFVPWLYKDGTGTLARHEPVPGEKLFGLVVGNKTKYVKGYKIVEQAQERFFEAFKFMQEGLIDEVNNMDEFK